MFSPLDKGKESNTWLTENVILGLQIAYSSILGRSGGDAASRNLEKSVYTRVTQKD